VAKDQGEYIIGVDTGGTFTDAVIVDDKGNVSEGKALTNYEAFEKGVLEALETAAKSGKVELEEVLRNASFFGHGTTLGTNAVINRKFAKVGLITTRGHEDVTLIMRSVGRTDGLSELEIRHQALCHKPEPIVPRFLIKGITERVDCFGQVVIPLNRDEVEKVVDELVEEGIEAIAVCFLWSFANPEHEQVVREFVTNRYPDLFVVISSEIVPEIREYARSMTVVIEAAIGSLMGNYISNLNRRLKQRRLTYPISIMQAFGGVTSSDTAKAISTIESGPAGGVIGSLYLAQQLGEPNVISTDVGGTSFDVSIIADNSCFFAREPLIDRFRVLIPMIDITSVGAGGGTIAKIDPYTDRLKVGPESAGSTPGPVCYDRGGTEPTVTDADLILGYLNPQYFFGGRMTLNKRKAIKAMEDRIAKPMGMSAIEAAAGIYEMVNAFMSDNLRSEVIAKGYDPRDFLLLGFGGNGPLHVASYAKKLGVTRAYVPRQGPVFSAFGIAASDVVQTYKFSEVHNLPVDPRIITETFRNLEAKALDEMFRQGFKQRDVIIERELDMRYGRQVHQVNIPIKIGDLTQTDIDETVGKWEERYEVLFGKGSAYREAGIQIVSFRVTARYQLPKPRLGRQVDDGDSRRKPAVPKGQRDCFFRESYNDFIKTNIYDFDSLQTGYVIEGPAVVEGEFVTGVILPGQVVSVDRFGGLLFEKL
jgi:N-methylhydantoinase A